MLEGKVLEERDPYLEEEEDIGIQYSREEHRRDASEKNDEEKSKVNVLRFDVYMKQKEELIKIKFLLAVPHPKRGNIFGTCVKDNIIEEKEDYKDNGIRGFDYKLFQEEEGVGW